MNTKFAVAVLFALVSVSLCDIPPPSQELVDKYEGYKSTFLKRITNALNKIQGAVGPMAENAGSHPQVQVAKDYVEDLQSKDEFKAIVKVATNMGAEAAPLVDKARTTLLGAYEHYLRPHIGTQLSDAIDNIKVYLDKILPAE